MLTKEQLEEALKQVLEVEREHLFSDKTGAESARRSSIQRVVDKIIRAFEEQRENPKPGKRK